MVFFFFFAECQTAYGFKWCNSWRKVGFIKHVFCWVPNCLWFFSMHYYLQSHEGKVSSMFGTQAKLKDHASWKPGLLHGVFLFFAECQTANGFQWCNSWRKVGFISYAIHMSTVVPSSHFGGSKVFLMVNDKRVAGAFGWWFVITHGRMALMRIKRNIVTSINPIAKLAAREWLHLLWWFSWLLMSFFNRLRRNNNWKQKH